jgi:hypothetical protein
MYACSIGVLTLYHSRTCHSLIIQNLAPAAKMCHYTIRRCCQCGSYLEVIPKLCMQNNNGFCAKDKTNDGHIDDFGIDEVMCMTNVPLPFIAYLYSDGSVHGIYALHKVQELLALCPSCSSGRVMGRRAMDLGGFLFHLDFERGPWEKPLRVCQGRYVVGYCQDKKCHKAKCKDCELTGTCGHHGPLQDFKLFVDYRQSMSSLLAMHTCFLDEPDKYHRSIRRIYSDFPTPQPEPPPALIPSPFEPMASTETISESAQSLATIADSLHPRTFAESAMIPPEPAPHTPPGPTGTSCAADLSEPFGLPPICLQQLQSELVLQGPVPPTTQFHANSTDLRGLGSLPESTVQPLQASYPTPPTPTISMLESMSCKSEWKMSLNYTQAPQLFSPPNSDKAFGDTAGVPQVLPEHVWPSQHQTDFRTLAQCSGLETSNQNPFSTTGTAETSFGYPSELFAGALGSHTAFGQVSYQPHSIIDNLFDIGNNFEQADNQILSSAGAGTCWGDWFPELDATVDAMVSEDEPTPGTSWEGSHVEEPQGDSGEGQRHKPDQISPFALYEGSLLGQGAPLAMY